MLRDLPTSKLFPYTTLFRSVVGPSDTRNRLAVTGQAADHLARRHLDQGQSAPLVTDERGPAVGRYRRSEEHTSELSHLVISYAVFCLKKKIIIKMYMIDILY